MRALPAGLITAILAVAAGIHGTQVPQQDSRSAAQILAIMAQTYRDCKTYTDSGIARTVFINKNRPASTHDVRFTTAFVRPDRFRYEALDSSAIQGDIVGPMPQHRNIVWQRGSEVRTWWDIEPDIQTEPSLSLALAGAGYSAHTVSVLLLPKEVEGNSLTGLKDLMRLEDAKLGAVLCFRIRGKFQGEPLTLWIDSKTFLIRRIDGGKVFDDFRTEETTTYEPVVNGQVSEEKLAFGAPGQK